MSNAPIPINRIPNTLNIVGDIHQINFSIDDFKDMRNENFLYVDKTKMIEDMLSYDRRKTILFTRPRRFGKSLNLSMLRYFFDMTEDSGEIFKDLYIEGSKVFKDHVNQYPVLYLNFKNVTTKSENSIRETLLFTIKQALEELHEKHEIDDLRNITLETQDGNIQYVQYGFNPQISG